jgi:hypothetical protein
LFLAFETADKAEVKTTFASNVKAWGAWSYYSYTLLYSVLEEVSAEFEAPAALPPEQEPP